MSLISFLNDLDEAIGSYTDSFVQFESTTIRNNRRNEILEYELALMYYNIIKDYFTDTGISNDENFMTAEEIQIVIDKLNYILNTYLYYEDIISFSAADIPPEDYLISGDEEILD